MPTRLLLEGEDLPVLMARVRAEMGPGARIVKAEKVRTGGVAGFFAKEHYELTVEVPEPQAPARRGSRPARGARPAADAQTTPVGLDALLAAADAADERAAGGSEGSAGAPSAAAGSDGSGRAGEADAPPSMSTSTPRFAEILASMRQMVDTPPAPEEGAAGAPVPATDSFEASPVPPADDPPQDGPAPPADAPPPTDPVPPADTPAELVQEVPDGAVPVDAHAVEGPPRDGTGSSAAGLMELGVPARLLAGVADPTAPVPLSVLVRRFDRPPSVRLLPGGVLAVVGPPDLALRTAVQMAQRADVEPSDVVLAGAMPAVAGHGRRLTTAAAVARLRSRVPEDVPTIVAIGVPEGRDGWATAAELLAALTPHQAWAAVDARRKAVDLRRWLRAVGTRRPFDALAVCHTFDAQAPGTVLALGTPVGWVDGLPASPVVWAAVLSERLTDDARWD